MKNVRYLLPVAVFGALALFFYIGLYRNPGELPSPFIGKQAPAFSLPSLHDENKLIATADYRGRPYVVNVWGTWCVSCREEHETLMQIASASVVPIIGIDWKDERELALQWLARLGNPYTAVAFDADGRVAIDWGVYGAPETFLVGADGRVLYKRVGVMTPQIWQAEFLPRITGRQSSAR